MKAIELIAKLRELVKEHGDQEVEVAIFNYGDAAELTFESFNNGEKRATITVMEAE